VVRYQSHDGYRSSIDLLSLSTSCYPEADTHFVAQMDLCLRLRYQCISRQLTEMVSSTRKPALTNLTSRTVENACTSQSFAEIVYRTGTSERRGSPSRAIGTIQAPRPYIMLVLCDMDTEFTMIATEKSCIPPRCIQPA
jgi:hypothetical protein